MAPRRCSEGGGLSFLFRHVARRFRRWRRGRTRRQVCSAIVLYARGGTAADAYGTDLINKAGGDARGLASMLDKIGGATEPGTKILLDHPETKARVAAINKAATVVSPRAFLNASEWAALKNICCRILGMARRPLHDEPTSKVATWSSRLGLFAFAVAALSIIIVRSGLLEIVPALATFGAALVFAGLARSCSRSRRSL